MHQLPRPRSDLSLLRSAHRLLRLSHSEHALRQGHDKVLPVDHPFSSGARNGARNDLSCFGSGRKPKRKRPRLETVIHNIEQFILMTRENVRDIIYEMHNLNIIVNIQIAAWRIRVRTTAEVLRCSNSARVPMVANCEQPATSIFESNIFLAVGDNTLLASRAQETNKNLSQITTTGAQKRDALCTVSSLLRSGMTRLRL